MSSINLTHHFLIAMPAMADPYFTRTLTYICEHNDQGALGVVVNRPIDMTLRSLFDRLSLPIGNDGVGDAPIYFGGPVQTDRGFVLHEPTGNWQSTLKVRDAVGLTTSKDILEAVGRGEDCSEPSLDCHTRPERARWKLDRAAGQDEPLKPWRDAADGDRRCLHVRLAGIGVGDRLHQRADAAAAGRLVAPVDGREQRASRLAWLDRDPERRGAVRRGDPREIARDKALDGGIVRMDLHKRFHPVTAKCRGLPRAGHRVPVVADAACVEQVGEGRIGLGLQFRLVDRNEARAGIGREEAAFREEPLLAKIVRPAHRPLDRRQGLVIGIGDPAQATNVEIPAATVLEG